MIKYTSIDEVIGGHPFGRYYYYHNHYCFRGGYEIGDKYYGLNEDTNKPYTIKDIAKIDSGYIKDVFLQNEEIIFSEEDFQTLKELTKGQKENDLKKEIEEIIVNGVYFEPYLYDFNDNILELINNKRINDNKLKNACSYYKIDDNRHLGFYTPESDGIYDVDIMFGEPFLLDKRSITVGSVRIISAYCKIEKSYKEFGNVPHGWCPEWVMRIPMIPFKWSYKAVESHAIITVEFKKKHLGSFENIETHRIGFKSLEDLTSKIELLNQYIDNGFSTEMIDFDFRVPIFYHSKCNEGAINSTFFYAHKKEEADNNDLWNAARTIKRTVREHLDLGNGRTHDYAWDEETITIKEADLYIFCLIYLYFYRRFKTDKRNRDYDYKSNCLTHYPGIEVTYNSDTKQGELDITNYGEFGHDLAGGWYKDDKGEKPLETDEYRRLIRFLIQNYDGDLRIFINMMLSNDIGKVSSIIEKQVPIVY